tara:strand:+ start:1860 stop:2075 length:216 start_codon:yes stop_codon:yes gene_type:complete
MSLFEKKNFEEAVALFRDKAGKNYTKVPHVDHSSARMGGWLMKDKHNMMIGWVGHVAMYKCTTTMIVRSVK